MISPSILTSLVILEATLTVIALLLLVKGVRGRVELTPPRCDRCDHDLRSAGTMPTRCPECGGELARPGAVRYGRRRRSPGVVALAIGLLAASILLPSLLLAVVARRGLQPPLRNAPQSTPTLDQVIAGAEEGGVIDWRDLALAVRLSKPETEEVVRLIRVLERHGAASLASLSPLDRFLLDDAGHRLFRAVEGQEFVALAKFWVGPMPLLAPRRVSLGEAWAVRVHARELVDGEMLGKTADGLPMRMSPILSVVRLEQVRLNGIATEPPSVPAQSGATGTSLLLSLPPVMRPGPIDLEIDVVRVLLNAEDLPRSGPPSDPSLWPAPITEERFTLRRVVEVVEPGTPLVTRTSDPALREKMENVMRVITCREESIGGQRRLVIETRLVPPGGIWIAGRWRVGVDDRWLEGPRIAAWGKPTNFGINGPLRWSVPLGEMETPSSVDVVIEPDDGDPNMLPRDGTPVWGERIGKRVGIGDRGLGIGDEGSEAPFPLLPTRDHP